jgi:autotransporter strand-loop-strand O-heptosyltransferase
VLDDDTRPIAEPYVCIGTRATGAAKHWNNPTGWQEVVAFLKGAGYRVIVIDREPPNPLYAHGAEDQTGDRPLLERARWLRHAEFFVSLSSGLSWLAWAVGTPVVMVSGFTHPVNEFATPWRVINYHACNSCWNNPAFRFDQDFFYCPRHRATEHAFICTKMITSKQVIEAIMRVPGFQAARLSSTATRASRSATAR